MSERPKILTSRRTFFLAGGLAALGVSAGVDVMRYTDPVALGIPKFRADQFGLNVQPDKAYFYKENPDELLNAQLELPSRRLRIRLPLSEIYRESDKADFSSTDSILNQIADKNAQLAPSDQKIFDLQMGIKVFGGKEVELPGRWMDKYPYLRQKGVQIDRDPEFVKFILEKYVEVGSYYLSKSEYANGTKQGDNEPLSKNLEVSSYRYESPEFLDGVIKLLDELDPFKRPTVQNVPWDTPWLIPWVLDHPKIDVIGANVYNNIYPDFGNDLLWRGVNWVNSEAKKRGKKFGVLEYQFAPWIGNDMNPVFPFSPARRMDGLMKIQLLDPYFAHGWDCAQIRKRAKMGESESKDFLEVLPQMVELPGKA